MGSTGPEWVGAHTLRKAQFAADRTYEDMPQNVLHFVKRSIFDGIGCAVSGTVMGAIKKIDADPKFQKIVVKRFGLLPRSLSAAASNILRKATALKLEVCLDEKLDLG